MILLKNYIKEILNKDLFESFNLKDKNIVDNIIKKLNSTSIETMNDLKSQGDEKYYYYYIFNYLENVLYENKPRCEELGEGAYRIGYEIPGTNLVLKLAKDDRGAEMNKQELEISRGRHGSGSRDIFIKIYEYDTISDDPYWMVCERVDPLGDVNDLVKLSKVFPTFWSILKDENPYKRIPGLFRELISDTLNYVIINSKVKKSKKYKDRISNLARFSKDIAKDDSKIDNKLFFGTLIRKEFYDIFVKKVNEKDVLSFEEVIWGEDFKKLATGLSHISTEDLHQDNWGIRYSDASSPDDIVILDFQLY